jgi:3-dehydroquinate dehydratase-1
MFFSKQVLSLIPGAVVGTVWSASSLALGLKLRNGALDFLELRVDAFAAEGVDLDRLEQQVARLKIPLIVTVRHPLEGGAGALKIAERRALFARFLPYASLVDLELRSVEALRELMAQAHAQKVGVILSHHDFLKTPSLARLRELRRKATFAGASVFKLACTAQTARDLAVLVDFISNARPASPALAVMGMGEFGKISRLTLGRAGSVLNYGYLDQAQVPGQWPAQLLKERLAELA